MLTFNGVSLKIMIGNLFNLFISYMPNSHIIGYCFVLRCCFYIRINIYVSRNRCVQYFLSVGM